MFIISIYQGQTTYPEKHRNRSLSANAYSGKNSVLTGTATSSFSAFETVSLQVQAKDDLNNLITTGGDKFVVEIKNECIITEYLKCNPVAGATTVINPEIKAYMTDNKNGTYSYSFILTKLGKITILVYLEPLNPVLFEVWCNKIFSGNECNSYWYSNINNSWTSGYITSSYVIEIAGRFQTYLVPPISDTYKIYWSHDDGGRLSINGVVKIDNWQNLADDSFTIYLNAGEYYYIVAEFCDYGGLARAILSWEYTGNLKTAVPSSQLIYHSYLNNTPLTINVLSSCGNKVITSNEECDDGNTSDGDCCNSQCMIESGCICINFYDSWCYKCDSGYHIDYTHNQCVETDKSQALNILIWLYSSFLLYQIIFSFILNVIYENSFTKTFNLLNHIQLILLLPLLPNSISDNVILFIAGLNYCLMNFEFIYNFSKNQLIQPGFDLNFSQPNSYFKLINLDSGSLLLNLQGCAILFILIFMIYLAIVGALRFLLKKRPNSKSTKFLLMIKEKIMNGFIKSYIIQSYLLVCLACFSEYYRFEYLDIRKAMSLIISAFALAYIFVVLMICIRYWIRRFDENDLPAFLFFKSFFDGVQTTQSARTYLSKLLFQRIILCLIVIILSDLTVYTRAGIFCFFQFLFCCYSIIIRPFTSK